MAWYRLAGQEFLFSCPVPELAPFETTVGRRLGTVEEAVPFVFPASPDDAFPAALVSQTTGWVAGASRSVEVWSASPDGYLILVEGASNFYVSRDGRFIGSTGPAQPRALWNETDRQVAAGPIIVLALALRNIWCLHASAVMFREKVIIFLGESGQGKSTLSAYLARNSSWRLVSDDILPVRMQEDHITLLPYFPQLKMTDDVQPAIGLPEQLPSTLVCILGQEDGLVAPALEAIPTAQGAQTLLQHTAGTRMFHATLLAKHMDECVRAAGHLSFYRLSYPPCEQVLPEIREMLTPLC